MRFIISVAIDITAFMLIISPFFVSELGIGGSVLCVFIGLALFGIKGAISKILNKVGF